MLGVSGLTLSGLEPQRVPSLMRLTYPKDYIRAYHHMYVLYGLYKGYIGTIQGLHRDFIGGTRLGYGRFMLGFCRKDMQAVWLQVSLDGEMLTLQGSSFQGHLLHLMVRAQHSNSCTSNPKP